jgi:hypothetical protein
MIRKLKENVARSRVAELFGSMGATVGLEGAVAHPINCWRNRVLDVLYPSSWLCASVNDPLFSK